MPWVTAPIGEPAQVARTAAALPDRGQTPGNQAPGGGIDPEGTVWGGVTIGDDRLDVSPQRRRRDASSPAALSMRRLTLFPKRDLSRYA